MAMSAYSDFQSRARHRCVRHRAGDHDGAPVCAYCAPSFRYLERYYTHTATFRILTHLRVWFYASIEPLAPARLMPYRSGDLLTRIIGDIETLENFYVRVVVPPVAAVLVTTLRVLDPGRVRWFARHRLVGLSRFDRRGLALRCRAGSVSEPATALIATRAELNALLVDEIQGIADLLSFDQAQQHQSACAGVEPGTQSHAGTTGDAARCEQCAGGAVHQPGRPDRVACWRFRW